VVGEHCGETTFIKDNISGINGSSNRHARIGRVAGNGKIWIGTGCVTMNRLAARVLTGYWPWGERLLFVSFGPEKITPEKAPG